MGGLFSRSKPAAPIQKPVDIKAEARKELGLDTDKYNFGVSGHTKAGKSSLVNSFLKNEAAAVGEFETTQTISKYEVPAMPNIVLWDIPGSGTQNHSAQTYFTSKKLYVFDCLIILTQDMLTQEEISLALDAIRHNQPIIFARSRCDVTLENMKKMRRIPQLNQEAADKFVDEMAIKFERELKKTGHPELAKVRTFFISSYIMRDIMDDITPDYHFQEKEFLREVKVASSAARGQK
jgi:small GTP-binding protein